MRNLSLILALLMLVCAVSACGATYTGVLYADFSCGNTDPDSELVRDYPFEYTGSKKAEAFAKELSTLTGLDFKIKSKKTDDGIIVDWQKDSTLIAGLDDREQKEEFFFHDYDSLCWFMMDSLSRTLVDNLEVKNVYFTMDGGKELRLNDLSPAHVFPSDIPYLGSGFYFAHRDLIGEDDENLFLETRGLWKLDGADDTARIEMDGLGGFTLYYADGAVEASGHLEIVEDNGTRYDMYNMSGELIDGFYLDSATELHFGNNEGREYILSDSTVDDYLPNSYYDDTTGLLFTYPNVFSSEGKRLPDGKVDFYTLWDAGMHYWTAANEGVTIDDYIKAWNPEKSKVIDDNILIGCGTGKDPNGADVPIAIYFIVNSDIIIHIEIFCTSEDEAEYWFERFEKGSFSVTNTSIDGSVG